MLLHRFRLSLCWLGALALSALAADAPMTEWRDAKGVKFRGEPTEAMGSMALFRTGSTSSRFLPMTALSADDCVRFHRAIEGRPPRAGRWSEAKGRATRELVGAVDRVENGKVQPFDFAQSPEPELLLVLCGSLRSENFYPVIHNLAPFAMRVQRVYPGRVAVVVMGSWQTPMRTYGIYGPGPWYIPNPGKLPDLKTLSRFLPDAGVAAVLMSREGVPLIGGYVEDIFDAMKFIDGASEVLWTLNPENPGTWRDRLHYLRAVRPVQFAADTAPPLAIADPFRADALRARGVKRVAARVEVDRSGTVTQVGLKTEAELPAAMAGPVVEAIRRSGLFLPAIEHGQPVAGVCDYTFVVPPALATQAAADAAWVQGEARVDVPFERWLVLKPVRLSEQAFSVVLGVGDDGITRMSAVTAGEAGVISKRTQMTAFNSDWFGKNGAGNVRGIIGEYQEIDGKDLQWTPIKPKLGYVDLLSPASYGSHDYCVGYAWTEVEVSADTPGWLGMGSDDGVKIWVNGELVCDKWESRTSKLDDDVVPLKLRAGKNQVLVKIQNIRGWWSFTARLRVRSA